MVEDSKDILRQMVYAVTFPAISQEGTRILNVTAYTICLNVFIESSTIYSYSAFRLPTGWLVPS